MTRPATTPFGLGRCLRTTRPFDKLRANGGGWNTPFGLSLSKPWPKASGRRSAP